MKKLIIWDFDGVIANSEKLWVAVWDKILKQEKNIFLTDEQKQDLLVGIADRNRKQNIEKTFPPVELDDDFMQKIYDEEIYQGTNFMEPIKDVECVMSDNRFDHCIGTGATKEQHSWKMTQFKWIEKYIDPKNFFTVDMVTQGKPEPDLFLLAAKTMGYKPEDCIVIGDSVNDFIAAHRGGMKSIAFVGADGNDTAEYRKKCIDTGVIAVCSTMTEIKQVINNYATDN